MRQTKFLNDREHMFLQRRVRSVLQTKLLVVLNESFHEGLEKFLEIEGQHSFTVYRLKPIEVTDTNFTADHSFIIICNIVHIRKICKDCKSDFFIFDQ